MAEPQKLKHLTDAERKALRMTADTNRRHAQSYQRELQRRQGKNVCTWCGAEPCGHLWTRPGDADIPGGERCCDRCSHLPVEAWQHTHTAWNGAASYPVCAIRMREGDVVYMRRDGIIMFLEMQQPAPPGSPTPFVPTVAFLGEDGGTALYTRGEGAAEHTNLWNEKPELDIVWLPVRMAAAVSADETRKRALADDIARKELEWQRAEDERRAADKAKLAASIDKRQLAHETRVVMDELEAKGELDEDEDEDEDDGEDEATAEKPVEAPRLSLADLKKPRPVKKVPGRPKRSKRQREARKRQKRAWARQEAAQRLEVKRFGRTGRNSGPGLVKEDE